MTPQNKSQIQTPPEHIRSVNRLLLGACAFGLTAWLIWPETAWLWGLYPLSMMIGAAALSLAIQAIIKIRDIWKFERDQKTFAELGSPMKTASLADADVLTNKGVIRHGKD